MHSTEWIQIGALLILLAATIPLLGSYMAAVFQGERTLLSPLFAWMEKGIYRICGIDPETEMHWKTYAKSMVIFNAVGLAFLFAVQRLQSFLPLNPQHFSAVEWTLAFNTAISFVTTANWQAYGGENTMSYLTQMTSLSGQNFMSAATGNAVLLALIRGIHKKSEETIGNFWVDLTRTIVYLLLPLCIVFSLILVSQGVIQNLNSYVEAETVEGHRQIIPMGPTASQVAIKQLGANGGGFFAANSAHPFENPTPLSNFLGLFSILCLPAATVYMYGQMIKCKRHGALILTIMFILMLWGLSISLYSERLANPVLNINPVLEGKEVRLGSVSSVEWSVYTTATSNGSVNSMQSSLSPLSGGVALFNIMLDEVIFGGVGVGLCGMIMYILLTVFLAGLMVGRTPEYLGKKIEKREMQWAMLAILGPCGLILLGAGIACLLPMALESLGNKGPHGLTEILYAFSSAAGNNGSAFAGLQANTPFFNLSLGIVMLLGRLCILLPSLAIAGSLVRKKILAPSLGTFETESVLFAILLICVIFVVAALTFFPALSLGPVVEQILMLKGRSF